MLRPVVASPDYAINATDSAIKKAGVIPAYWLAMGIAVWLNPEPHTTPSDHITGVESGAHCTSPKLQKRLRSIGIATEYAVQ